jgi:surface polysaccharide O-acyltransferase-like enzyme
VAILTAAPFVWSAQLSTRVPLFLGGYLDPAAAPSQFPLFPYAAFVLAGTVAGAWLGRTDRASRHRRSVRAALALVIAGVLLSIGLAGHVDFWSVSPGYALLRMSGLVLALAAVEWAASRELPGTRVLGLLGHETLAVYVLHLVILFGGVLGHSPLLDYAGRLGFRGALAVLVAMFPILYGAAWTWHRFKMRRPHAAHLTLAFVTVLVLWQLLTRPW